MATVPTQATGTSPFQNKVGGGNSALGSAFLNNQAAPQVNVPTISAPLGALNGGMSNFQFPASYAPTPLAQPQAAVAPAQQLQRGQFYAPERVQSMFDQIAESMGRAPQKIVMGTRSHMR